jgi:hypothetical protein
MTGQMVSVPIIPGRDYVDALRVSQKPFPSTGTWGLVAFPHGDLRNGIWLCAYPPSFLDALTTTGDPTDPFIDYESHFSGNWSLLDGKGNFATQFADGSSLVAGAASGLPTIYRNTVDTDQNRQQVPFTQAQRVPNPPSGFFFNFKHISGTSFSIDPSGNVAVSGVAGTTLTLTFDTIILNGNVIVNS